MLQDSFGREFHYLRLSVTDVCNFRCTYCLPDGYEGKPDRAFLSLDELRRVVAAFAATGTTKIRFTVDATGKVSKAEIEKSAGPSREHRLLDRTAIDALSKCPFKPGTDENGQAVGATTVVEYVWKTE